MSNKFTTPKILAHHIYKAGEKAQKYWCLASAIYCDFNSIAVKQTLVGEYDIPEIVFCKGWDKLDSVHETSIELSSIIRTRKHLKQCKTR